MDSGTLIVFALMISLIAVIIGGAKKLIEVCYEHRVSLLILLIMLLVLISAFLALIFTVDGFSNAFGILMIGAMAGVAYLLFKK